MDDFDDIPFAPRHFLEGNPMTDQMRDALEKCLSALEWAVEQGGGPECEHESGVVCFCKENGAINAAREALASAQQADHIGDVSEMVAAPVVPEEWRQAVAGLVDDIDGLICESSGVCGLHLNGDMAPWDELTEGGRFERLTRLETVRALLAAHEAKQGGGEG